MAGKSPRQNYPASNSELRTQEGFTDPVGFLAVLGKFRSLPMPVELGCYSFRVQLGSLPSGEQQFLAKGTENKMRAKGLFYFLRKTTIYLSEFEIYVKCNYN